MKKKHVLVLYLFIMCLPGVSSAQVDLMARSLIHAPDSVETWTPGAVADSLMGIGQISLAKRAYQQALAIAQKGGDLTAVGLANRGIGYWYESTGDYVKAIYWYQKAMKAFRQGNNQKQLARTLSFISFSYGRLRQDKLALYYINQCKLLAEKSHYVDLLMACYQQLATYEVSQKQYQAALDHHHKALVYYQIKRDWKAYYGALYTTGLLYKDMGHYDRSERLLRHVLAFAEQHKDTGNHLAGYVFVSLPDVLIPQGKLAEAEAFCRKARAWVEKTGTEKHALLEEINGQQSQIAEQRGDFKNALVFYKQQMANHDSVFNVIKSQQVAELETRYQTKAKEESLQQLGETSARQTRQLWFSIVVMILLIGLLGALYALYKRVSRSREEIQQQSDQLALMMRELHHRSKNNLAIVSSLLFLQANYLEDSDMIQEIRVSQQRVEAMSLIHQRLYQGNQTTKVNMREYVTDLAESLLHAYGYQLSNVDLQLQIDLVDLDVDIAIPLGLIVNEVLTNAFKYAYTECDTPLLRIALHKASSLAQPGLVLEVQDNGPGIDMADWGKAACRKSFGKKLIALLVEQLDGQFTLTKQQGTLFRLYIPQNSQNRLLSK